MADSINIKAGLNFDKPAIQKQLESLTNAIKPIAIPIDFKLPSQSKIVDLSKRISNQLEIELNIDRVIKKLQTTFDKALEIKIDNKDFALFGTILKAELEQSFSKLNKSFKFDSKAIDTSKLTSAIDGLAIEIDTALNRLSAIFDRAVLEVRSQKSEARSNAPSERSRSQSPSASPPTTLPNPPPVKVDAQVQFQIPNLNDLKFQIQRQLAGITASINIVVSNEASINSIRNLLTTIPTNITTSINVAVNNESKLTELRNLLTTIPEESFTTINVVVGNESKLTELRNLLTTIPTNITTTFNVVINNESKITELSNLLSSITKNVVTSINVAVNNEAKIIELKNLLSTIPEERLTLYRVIVSGENELIKLRDLLSTIPEERLTLYRVVVSGENELIKLRDLIPTIKSENINLSIALVGEEKLAQLRSLLSNVKSENINVAIELIGEEKLAQLRSVLSTIPSEKLTLYKVIVSGEEDLARLRSLLSNINSESIRFAIELVGEEELSRLRSLLANIQTEKINIAVELVGSEQLTQLRSLLDIIADEKTTLTRVIVSGYADLVDLKSLINSIESKSIVIDVSVVGLDKLTQLQDLTKGVEKEKNLFDATLKAIEQITGKTFNLPPSTISENLGGTTKAEYRPGSNKVVLKPKQYQDLIAGEINFDLVESIAHELRHAFQFSFGSLAKAIESGTLLKGTEEELRQFGSRIDRSVANYVKQQGNKATPELIAQVRAAEEDAYTFVARNLRAIYQSISAATGKTIKPLQLADLNLPQVPVISSRAFLNVENSKQLEDFLSGSVSSVGLTELSKRLGLPTNVNKKQGKANVIKAYEQDANLVLEKIARLGDSIRLQTAKVGEDINFGSIENVDRLKEDLAANLAALKVALNNIDLLGKKEAIVLGRQIKQLTEGQIKSIDEVVRNFDVSGANVTSLSATKQQFEQVLLGLRNKARQVVKLPNDVALSSSTAEDPEESLSKELARRRLALSELNKQKRQVSASSSPTKDTELLDIQKQIEAEKLKTQEFLKLYKKLKEFKQEVSAAVNAGDTQKADRYRRAIEQLITAANQKTGSAGLKEIQKELREIEKVSHPVVDFLSNFGGYFSATAILYSLQNITKGIVQTQIKFEQLSSTINATSGGVKAGAENFDFIVDTSDRLKVSVDAATEGFAKLSGATRGTSLEGEKTRRIFENITTAARVYNLSSDEVKGTIKAFSDIISKGTVQSEELKGQIGDRLAGAFQIAARSMGVTTQALQKLLETGSIAAEDFVFKFAERLGLESNYGLSGALNTTGAAAQNLQNKLLLLQNAIGEGIKPTVVAIFNGLASAIAFSTEHSHGLTLALTAIASLIAVSLIPNFTAFGLSGLSAFNKLTAGAFTAEKALLTLKRAAATFGILAIGSEIIGSYFSMKSAIDEAHNSTVELDKQYLKLLESLNKTPSGQIPGELIAQQVDKNIEEAKKKIGLFGQLTDPIKNFLRSNPFNDKKIKVDGGALFTFEESLFSNLEKEVGDSLFRINQTITRSREKNDITLFDTDQINLFIASLEASKTTAQNIADTAINPTQLIESKELQKEITQELDRYNQELQRRKGLELNLAQIILPRDKAIQKATEAEVNAISDIENLQIQGTLSQENAEKQKLQATLDRTSAQLEAEKLALSQIAALNDDGKGLSTKELEEYTKSEKEITKLTREESKLRLQVAESEVKEKIAIAEKLQQESIAIATETEKERNIEVQQLINAGAITTERAEQKKLDITKRRILAELDAEEGKLESLNNIDSKTAEIEQKKRESKQKTLDLTLQLLENEKQAEEATINAIIQARSRQIEKLDAIASAYDRISQIRQSYTDLEKANTDAKQSIAQLEIDKLKQALELERQLTDDRLETEEQREVIYRQLNALGLKGYENQYDLVDRIRVLEENLAKNKLTALLQEQKIQRENIEDEIKKNGIVAKKVELEARSSYLQASKGKLDAQKLLAGAKTQEDKQYAESILDISTQQLSVSEELLKTAELDTKQQESKANKMRENLNLQQKLSLEQLKNTNATARFETDKEQAQAEADRVSGTALDPNVKRQRELDLAEAVKIDRNKEGFVNRGTVFDEFGNTILTAAQSAIYGSGKEVVELFKKWFEEDRLSKIKTEESGKVYSQVRSEFPTFAVPKLTIETPEGFKNVLGSLTFDLIKNAIVERGEVKSRDDRSSKVESLLIEIKDKLNNQPSVNANFVNQFVPEKNDDRELLRKVRSQNYEDMKQVLENRF